MWKNIFLVVFFIISINCEAQEKITENVYREMSFTDFHFSRVLNSGIYYIINNYVEIYPMPNYNKGKIGNLKIHDEIRIIEHIHNEQTIDYITSCWYKIEFNQIIGYIWGGNIATETFIFDIDNNGILDYFQYRISRAFENFYIDIRKDILIYINDRIVNTENFKINDRNIYNKCIFNIKSDVANIELCLVGKPNIIIKYIFEMDRKGNIIIKDIVREYEEKIKYIPTE